MRARFPRWVPFAAIGAAALIVAVGVFWCLDRGGQDFNVFYTAWKLVLKGKGTQIYVRSPDRFLYAPGFAWLLAPVALLPKKVALVAWCLLKAFAVGGMIRLVQRAIPGDRAAALAVAAGGWLLVARPTLIDFQFGQVNLLVLAAALWAILPRYRARSAAASFASWSVLAIAAFAKVFALPLLLIPFLPVRGMARSTVRHERAGIVAGLAAIVIAPAVTLGFADAFALLEAWSVALSDKGLPLVSHNQSFLAFLHHYFSGEPTPVIARAHHPYQLGWNLLGPDAIEALGWAWTALSGAFVLLWIVLRRNDPPLRWLAVAVALLIVPSHLVWKPYFMLGYLAAVLCLRDAVASGGVRLLGPAILLVVVNFTGFDFVGMEVGARLEAASLLLFAHLALVALVIRGPVRVVGRRAA